ncbi:MAG TPA: hypothetical protein VN455_11530 [Methanotrichaceae archaeon]|nr:hypothetical protein [Methanotrichaceae archaeon]
MNSKYIAIIFLVGVGLTSTASAIYWSGSIDADSTHWSIYRESSNISFDLSGSVEGVISPVEFHGRMLSPYQSRYGEVGNNDVRLRQRTAALEGRYRSSDEITMQSTVYPDDIEIFVDKPVGTELYKFDFKNEQWPVIIKARRAISYSGRMINDRDFEGNNGDFVGANFLYNHELSKEQVSVIWLQRMNATVLATNDSIVWAQLKPTRYLGYQIQASSTGISDLSYRQMGSKYDIKHQNYPALSQGEERYYGRYNLTRKIVMRSTFKERTDPRDIYYAVDSWLPCLMRCSSAAPVDQKMLKSAVCVFNCA